MKDAYYFPHDANARNDLKMIKLRARFGYEGYGIFWAIIEVLRDQSDWKMDSDFIDVLSISIGVEMDKLTEIIEYLLELKLLKKTLNSISSDSLTRRMEYFEERKKTYRENGKKGGRPKAKENLNHNLNESKKKPTGYDLLKQNESQKKAVKVSKGNKVNKDSLFPFFFDKYGDDQSKIFRNGTGLIEKKIILWNIFESLGYEKPECAKYFDRIHERNFCDKNGDPYTIKMLVDEIDYYHRRNWFREQGDE